MKHILLTLALVGSSSLFAGGSASSDEILSMLNSDVQDSLTQKYLLEDTGGCMRAGRHMANGGERMLPCTINGTRKDQTGTFVIELNGDGEIESETEVLAPLLEVKMTGKNYKKAILHFLKEKNIRYKFVKEFSSKNSSLEVNFNTSLGFTTVCEVHVTYNGIDGTSQESIRTRKNVIFSSKKRKAFCMKYFKEKLFTGTSLHL